jgi:hypothetical protein
MGTRRQNVRVVLSLAKTEALMWDNLTSKTRNMIRKSSGHHLRPDERFWAVWVTNMSEKGIRAKLIPRPGRLFVEHDSRNRIIGGALVDLESRPASYVLGTKVSQWLMWQIIRACITSGIDKLDLGPSREGSSTHFFKTHLTKEREETIECPSRMRMLIGFILKRVNYRTYYVYRREN